MKGRMRPEFTLLLANKIDTLKSVFASGLSRRLGSDNGNNAIRIGGFDAAGRTNFHLEVNYFSTVSHAEVKCFIRLKFLFTDTFLHVRL